MFNQFLQALQTSIKALLANKGRSFLTMLGIIIGVGAVIVIIAVGAGAQSLIISQVKGLGSNLIGILPGKSEKNGPPASVLGIAVTTLTYGDAQAINDKANVPDLVGVSAHTMSIGTLSWRSNTYDTSLNGSTADLMTVEGGELSSGRFFTKEEEKNLSKVVVLGSEVKDQLFGSSEAVGQQIKINKHSFEVIGVMKKRGTVAFQNFDDQVFIPIITVQKLIAGVNNLGFIRAKVDNQENIATAINDIQATLRERHGISDKSGNSDDFTVESADVALGLLTTVTDALKYFLAAIAGLSLIVGGIGIMNIMLISVSERTREIGLRKAVGATNSKIRRQFLFESIIITFMGGIIGITGGVIFSFLIAKIAVYLGYDWSFVVSAFSILLAVSVSITVGLIFGLFPAIQASKLNPIEALRYE